MPERSYAPVSSSPLFTVPPGHLLLHLSSGKTAAFSLPSNPAASFYLYIPSSHPVSRRKRGEDVNRKGACSSTAAHTTPFPLVVCIHGSARDAQGVRDRWADMAEKEGFVVLCPLFPVDLEVCSRFSTPVQKQTDLHRRWMGCTTTNSYAILSSRLKKLPPRPLARLALDTHALTSSYWKWSTWFAIDGDLSRLSSLV
jgi:hypothetical protein